MTSQTKQLTTAFEKQSQHISGLLAELQEKESALRSQGEELQRCNQELDALKAEKQGEVIAVKVDNEPKEKRQERESQDDSVDSLEFQLNQDKKCAVTVTHIDSNAQKDACKPEILTSEAEKQKLISSEVDNASNSLSQAQRQGFVNSEKTQSDDDSASVKKETECGQGGVVVAELLALQQENRLLKQRIEALMVLDTNNLQALHTGSENQEDSVEHGQNTGHVTLSCSKEQKTPNVPSDIATEAQPLLLNMRRNEDKGRGLEREDERTAGADKDADPASQLQINHLQQQVMM